MPKFVADQGGSAGGWGGKNVAWYTSCDLHQRDRGYIITIIGKQSPMARRPQGVSGSVAMAMHWDSHGVQLGITTLLPLFRDSPCFPNTLSSTLLLPPPPLSPYASPPTSPASSPPHPSHLLTSGSPIPLCNPLAPNPRSSSSRRRSHSCSCRLRIYPFHRVSLSRLVGGSSLSLGLSVASSNRTTGTRFISSKRISSASPSPRSIMRETCKKREGMNTSYGRIYSFCWLLVRRERERKEGKKRLGGLIEGVYQDWKFDHQMEGSWRGMVAFSNFYPTSIGDTRSRRFFFLVLQVFQLQL